MHLMKLKKDGKTVGYLMILGGIIWFNNKSPDIPRNEWEYFWQVVSKFSFDEACPYVCKDKNGDKVFAGDRVMMQNPSSTLNWDIKGVITIPDDILAPFIRSDCANWSIDNRIELIKDRSEAE